MSLREDIEVLMKAVRQFSRTQENCNHERMCENDRSSTDDASSSDIEKCDGTSGEQYALWRASYRNRPAHYLDLDISAIPLTTEGDEHEDDTRPAVVQQTAMSFSCGQVASDDTLVAPPSGNTTALPYADNSIPFCQNVEGAVCASALDPVKSVMPTDCSIAPRKTSEAYRQSFLGKADDRTTQQSKIALNTTSSSSGNGSVSAGLPRQELRQMEEAYKRVARKLLAEIRRLDAHTTAMSAQCEGERQNWLRAQRELENQLVERDMLISTLKRQLQTPQETHESASVRGRHFNNDGESIMECQVGVRDTTETPMHNCPQRSGETYELSPFSALDTSSRSVPRRTQEESGKGGTSSPMVHGSFGADTDATRFHPLMEFLRRRLSSWGTSRVSDDETLQTRRTASPAGAAIEEMASPGGSPISVSVSKTEATPQFAKPEGSIKATGSVLRREVGNVNKRSPLDSDHQVRHTVPHLVAPHFYEEHEPRKYIDETQYKEQQYREHNKTPAPLFFVQEGCGRRRQTSKETRQHLQSCRLCCHNQSTATPCTLPISAGSGINKENRAVTRRGLRGKFPAKRSCRAASLSTRRARWNEEERENRVMLRELLVKYMLMEARLRSVQERLDSQEVEFQDVTGFLRDYILPFTADSQKLFSGVNAP